MISVMMAEISHNHCQPLIYWFKWGAELFSCTCQSSGTCFCSPPCRRQAAFAFGRGHTALVRVVKVLCVPQGVSATKTYCLIVRIDKGLQKKRWPLRFAPLSQWISSFFLVCLCEALEPVFLPLVKNWWGSLADSTTALPHVLLKQFPKSDQPVNEINFKVKSCH